MSTPALEVGQGEISMTEEVAPRASSTVVVVRSANGGFEVFMVRRHAESPFMANRYVYPGGTVDEEDCAREVAQYVEGLTPEKARERLGGTVSPLRAMGLYLAGLRETFEEAGILLARRCGAEAFVDLVSEPEVAERFDHARAALRDGAFAVSEWAEREGLVLAAGRLHYFAHWVTPPAEERRYDTRFFVAVAPDRQEPVHDDRETTDSGWYEPAQILAKNREGELQLAPPTMRTLQQLASFDSVAELVEAAEVAEPRTIMPRLSSEEGEIVLLLPGDPEYPDEFESATGEVTRLRMRDNGVWEPVSA